MIVDGILRKVLEEAGYPRLAELSTPETLEVLPKDVHVPVKDLLTGHGRFDEVAADLDPTLEPEIRRADAAPPLSGAPPDAGRRVLRLFFLQILHRDHALLDLRPAAFSVADDTLVWAPAKLVTPWDDAFLDGMRATLTGLFEGDDDAYDRGMRTLRTTSVAHLFRDLFTFPDPHAATFDVQDLVDTLLAAAKIFEASWLPFGLYVVALFETLEALGGPHDLLGAYEAARAADR